MSFTGAGSVQPGGQSDGQCEASRTRYRYQRVHRLTKTDEFSSVFAFKRLIRSEHFQLFNRPAEGEGARIGLIVAKKFVRRAHDRNCIRRIARESFRLLRTRLPARDLILRLSRPIPLPPDKAALRREIDALMLRLPPINKARQP